MEYPDIAKTVATFMGKRVEDMSREELIEALNFAANEIQRLIKEKQHERDFIFDKFVKS